MAALRENESALWGAGGRDATRWEGDQSSAEVNGFNARMAEVFDEQHFISPTFKYNFMHAPTMALPGVMFTLREVRSPPKTPTVDEIYEFIKTLFNKAQLSSECSLVCLVYVERLMETAHVPLLAGTWKPVLLCGLLLASKVRWMCWVCWVLLVVHVDRLILSGRGFCPFDVADKLIYDVTDDLSYDNTKKSGNRVVVCCCHRTKRSTYTTRLRREYKRLLFNTCTTVVSGCFFAQTKFRKEPKNALLQTQKPKKLVKRHKSTAV